MTKGLHSRCLGVGSGSTGSSLMCVGLEGALLCFPWELWPRNVTWVWS